MSAVADPADAHPLDRSTVTSIGTSREPPGSTAPGATRSCAACGSLPVPVRLLPSSAGLHVAVLVDGIDGGDDRALHDALVAEDLLVGSLPRCYRFSPAPGGLLLGFGAIQGDAVAEAIDALERVLVRVVTDDRRVDAS